MDIGIIFIFSLHSPGQYNKGSQGIKEKTLSITLKGSQVGKNKVRHSLERNIKVRKML
jgi:hypothetical protein